MRVSIHSGVAWVCLVGLLAACSSKTEAHLERFMESGSAQTTEPGPSIDPFAVATDGQVADTIHTRSFQEVAQRLGPHRTKITTRFAMTRGKHRVSLQEDDLIVQAQNGDFRVKVENKAGQGYELVYSADKLYIRNRFGPFHERSTLRGDQLRWRDSAYQGWAAVYRLFRGRLRFIKKGMVRYQGQEAIRFSVRLSKDPARLEGTPQPPAVPEGVDQYVLPIVPTPSARDRWRDHAQPLSATGSVWIDADRAVVLKVDLTGELSLPDPEEEGEIVLTVSIQHQTDGFGNPPSIAPPAADQIEAVPERIAVDTRPIDFYFGKGHVGTLGAAAGVARSKKKK